MTTPTKSVQELCSARGGQSGDNGVSLGFSPSGCMGPSPHGAGPAFQRNPLSMLSANISVVPGPTRAQLQAPGNPPERVLVVDDDAFIRRLNSMALLRSGYEVDTAEDGASAWDALHARDYHLMITDHNMPNLTGLELLRKLRAKNMPLPVIMASGSLPIEEFDRHPALKPAAMLCKPYLLNALVQTVRQVLGQATSLAHGVSTPQANTP